MRTAPTVALLLLCLTALGAAQQPILERRVSYMTGGLRIVARTFFPTGRGPFPGVVFNHGGIDGLGGSSLQRCRELARQGFAVFASSYRGEDGSDGVVEVAKGEVDDVLAGTRWWLQDKRVNPKQLGLVGSSHGALVSLLAASKEPRFKTLVFAYGVSDIVRWWHYLNATGQYANDALDQRIYGNGPNTNPDAFAIRDGLSVVPHLAPHLRVQILQGAKDRIVPPEQAQLLHQALQARGINSELHLYPESPHGFLMNRENETRASKPRGWAAQDAFAHMVWFLKSNLR